MYSTGTKFGIGKIILVRGCPIKDSAVGVGGAFFRCGRPHFWCKKTLDFS